MITRFFACNLAKTVPGTITDSTAPQPAPLRRAPGTRHGAAHTPQPHKQEGKA
jgi:hypothetical protein